MKQRIKELLKDKKSGKLLFIAGIIGLALIYISSVLPKETSKGEETSSSPPFSVLEYKDYLENEIKEIVAAISGDTAAVVTITLDSEITYVYADEKKENNQSAGDNTVCNTEQTYITVTDSDGSEKPLVVTAYMPKVRGVAIVCSASSADVIDDIEGAVTAALDITNRKVFISDKKGE